VTTVTGIASSRVPTLPGEHRFELLDDAINARPKVEQTAPSDSNDISISAKLQR
jgi:hypothetical protein